MEDKIWRGTGNIPTKPTQLLPSNFFGSNIPVSLEVEDIFPITGSVPTQGDFNPVRSFYLEEVKAYLIFDVANPAMVAIYLVDSETKEMLTSYTYMIDSCPIYTKDDQFVDCCVHHNEMTHEIMVSFLIVNSTKRTATVARFGLQIDHLREPAVEVGHDDKTFYIKMTDLLFFADIIAPGAHDAVAIPFAFVQTSSFGGTPTVFRSPEFNLSGVIEALQDTFHCGTFNTKYCNLTVDESGHYLIFIGSRITGYLGPFLEFPIDTQYVIAMDQGGANHKYALMGPAYNFMCWDETERHQPYKFNATIFDGRYVLCLEERKSRYIAPRRIFVNGIETEPGGRSYLESDKNWRGGAVADVYYPPQQANTNYPQVLYYTETGYPTAWDETSVLEPISREYVWTLVDICDILTWEGEPETPPQPPYSADVVFMADASGSMAGQIAQVQANIGTFVATLQSLGVTDLRVGTGNYVTDTFVASSNSGDIWGNTVAEANSLAAQLKVIMGGSATHNAAINYALNTWRMRPGGSVAKYIIIVSDAGNEGDSVTQAQAIAAALSAGVKICVVGPASAASFFSPLVAQTGGVFYDISGNWGPRVSTDLAIRIAEDAGANKNPEDWWDHLAATWRPRIMYRFTPVLDFTANSLLTIFHDTMCFIASGHVMRQKVNFLNIYDDFPIDGGLPQDSIYVPGLVPGEAINRAVIIKNESRTGTMKNITITPVDLPDDITVSISNFPTKMEPQEMDTISVTVQYNPTGATPVERHIDVRFKVTYWMQHVLNCTGQARMLIAAPAADAQELFFVPDATTTQFKAGFVKEIPMAPVVTDAYVTATSTEDGDMAKASNMVNNNFYVLPQSILDSDKYERIQPGPVSALTGLVVADTVCGWLKMTGPMVWHTDRDHNIDAHVYTWWLVNLSADASFIAHVHLDASSVEAFNLDMRQMGFMVIEYPDGNIIPPGLSRPVTFRWQPIFNPDGEQVTLQKTYHPVGSSQAGFPTSAYKDIDAVYNNFIYAHPNITPNVHYTHIWEETVSGEGLDLVIPRDYPLKKFDTKLLTPYLTYTELTVDTSTVASGFPFVSPDQIWGGLREDADDIPWTGVVDEPMKQFTYKEYASPAAGLDCLPSYVDHRFMANPDYLYNPASGHPFQLAPFNAQYSKDYAGTAFYGNTLVKSETVANGKYVSMDTYDDDSSEMVPCDESGNELAGWLLEDFWPAATELDSIKQYATVDQILFSREVYVKNRGTRTIPVMLNAGPSTIAGLSLQGITADPDTPVAPGTVVKMTLTFRYHYVFIESGYVNMVKQILFIPRFVAPLAVPVTPGP